MQDQPKDVKSVALIRRVVRDGVFGHEDFLVTTIVLTDGTTVGVSQYAEDAPHWGVDSAFAPNGFPMWVNGEGARYLAVKCIAEDIAAYLNDLRDAQVAAA